MNSKFKRILTFVLVFAILFTSSSGLIAASFKDVNDSWAKEYISWCADRGIINGYTDSTFRPDNKITKAEFATMLAKTISKEAPAIVDINFEDVKANDWYYASVRKLVAYGIVANEKNFYPNKLITRDLAVKWLGSTIDLSINPSIVDKFADAKAVENKAEFAKLLELNILGGYPNNTLRPQNIITRAEAAKLFYTYINLAVDKDLLIENLKAGINQSGDKSNADGKKEAKNDTSSQTPIPYRPRRPHKPDNPEKPGVPDKPIDDTKPVVPKKRFSLNIKSTDDYKVEITPQSKDGKYEEGQVIEVKITLLNDKKVLKQVLLNGKNIASVNGVYSFEMPSQDTSLEVILEKKPIEQKDDITLDFNNPNEEVEINRNSQLSFDAKSNDPNARDINLRLNRISDEHLVYLNTYPIEKDSASKQLISFVVPDYLEAGKYLLSVKSGRPESKIQSKVIIVKDAFEKIISVDPIDDITVTEGEDVNIPISTIAHFSDGSERFVKIDWNAPESFDKPGEYIVEGRIGGFDGTITIKVVVNKKRAKIESIVPIKDLSIVKGETIVLPKFIKVNMDDGTKEDRKAYWNEIKFSNEDVGTHTVEGYIFADEADINSKKLPIKINITIKDGEPFEAHFAILQKPNYYPFQKDAMLGLEKATGKEYAPSKGDYALVITLKDEKSVINSVEITPEDPSLDMMVRPVGETFPIDKRAFFMRSVSPINTKIIAKITIDGETYTKTANFVAGKGFKKEAVAIKEDLEFKFPQGSMELPENVEALYNDGSEANASITWDTTTVDVNTPGTYDVKGTLSTGLVVKAKVQIIEYKDIKLDFSEKDTVTVKQSEYIMPGKELTLSISGVDAKDIKSIEITSDNQKAVKIESYDKEFDGSDIKIKAKAVGIGKSNIICKLITTNGQEVIQKLLVNVVAIRDFKADEFAVIAKDGGKQYGMDTSKVRLVSKHQDLELFGKIDGLVYNAIKMNSSEEADAYVEYGSIIGKTLKVKVYLAKYDSVEQAELDIKVIAENDPFPWEDSKPKFTTDDFSLTSAFDDATYGYITKLVCTNPNADKIKSFGLYKEDGNSAFMEEVVSYEDGGYTPTELSSGEYTLKVFADDKGQDLLYEGKITYKSEETNDGFKAEDFKLTYEDTGWGGYDVHLECTNERKSEIKAFAVKDSEGKSIFDNEIANIDEGGFAMSEPKLDVEYTLKVFADDKGQDLLYECKIKFTK